MKEGQSIYVIRVDDLYQQDKDGNDIYPSVDELTDEEFIELSNGWHFDSIEEYIAAFNADANECPVPSYHYMRII